MKSKFIKYNKIVMCFEPHLDETPCFKKIITTGALILKSNPIKYNQILIFVENRVDATPILGNS